MLQRLAVQGAAVACPIIAAQVEDSRSKAQPWAQNYAVVAVMEQSTGRLEAVGETRRASVGAAPRVKLKWLLT